MEAKKEERNTSTSNNSDAAKIPESNPSKPMDSKQEVEKSNDPKIEEDFPGYPHYPSKEDIMDQRTDSHRVDMDVENLPNSNNKSQVSQRFSSEGGNTAVDAGTNAADDFSDLNPRTETTRDGLETLGTENAEIGVPQNVDSDDLSKRVPGTDLAEEDANPDGGRSTDFDVTPEERAVLENVSMPTRDEDNLRRAALDSTDFEGEQLNEDGFGEVLSSTDLDIPDEGDETTTESLGQGDEENKYYSLGSDRHDTQEEDPQSGPARDNY